MRAVAVEWTGARLCVCEGGNANSVLRQRQHGCWKNARGPHGKERFTENVPVGIAKNMERRADLLPPGGNLHQPMGNMFKGRRWRNVMIYIDLSFSV